MIYLNYKNMTRHSVSFSIGISLDVLVGDPSDAWNPMTPSLDRVRQYVPVANMEGKCSHWNLFIQKGAQHLQKYQLRHMFRCECCTMGARNM